jgi:PAS domain S-box-containing protein
MTDMELKTLVRSFSNILDTMQDAVVSMTLPDRTILYANPSFERIFGLPPQSIIDDPNSLTAILHPDDRDHVAQGMKTVMREGYVEFDHRIVRPDGQLRWVQRQIWINYDANGTAIQLNDTARDISSHKAAEERFETMFQLSPIPTVLVALDEGRYIDVNEAALKTLEYRRDEMVGVLSSELQTWADPQQMRQFIQAIRTHRRVSDFEIQYRKKSGEIGEAVIAAQLIELDGQTCIFSKFIDITARKKAEAALQASEERFRTLVEHASDGIFVANPQGNYIDVNSRGCALLGYTRDEILELHLNDLVVKDNLNTQPLRLDELKAGKALTSERLLKRKDGTFLAAEISSKMLPNGDLLGILRDITGRKAAEEALRLSEEKFSNAFHVGPAGLTITRIADGKFIDVNSAFCTLFEFSREEVIGHTSIELNMWTLEERKRVIQQQLETGGLENFELVLYAKSGKHVNVLFSSKEMQLNNEPCHLTTMIDITQRKQAEEEVRRFNVELEQRVTERTTELKRARNRLEAIFNHSSDGILLMDVHLEIQQANYTFEELFRLPSGGSMGTSLSVYCASEEAAMLKNYVAEVIANHQTRRLECHAHRPDGTTFDAELSIAPVNRSEQAVTNMVCIIRDITERKESERQLKYSASLQANVSDAVVVTNIQQHIQSWNAAAERIYGWHAHEVIGQELTHVLQPESLNSEDSFSVLAILLEQGWWQGESTHHHKDGSVRLILCSLSLIRDDHGTPAAIIAVNHDITERKQAERALRESEQMLQLVLDTIPVRVFWKDRDSVYQGCNHLYARDAGLVNTSEIVGKRDTDLPWRAQESAAFRKDDIAVIQSGSAKLDYEESQQTADGKHMIIQTNKLPLRDFQGQVIGLLGVYIDITQRKEVETALAQRQQAEHEMQEFMTVLHRITIRLTRTDQMDAFYRAVIEDGLKHFGFERLGLLLYDPLDGSAVGTYGTDVNGNLVPEHSIRLDPGSLTGIFKRTFDRSKRFTFDAEAPLYANLQSIGIGQNAAAALWNGELLGWLVIDNAVQHKPITIQQLNILALYALTVGSLLARKRAEFALRDSEEKFRRFIESAPVAVLITDQNGEIILLNHETEKLLDYNRDELLGKSIEELVPETHRETHVIKRNQFITGQSSPRFHPIEVLVRRKDGSVFPADIQLSYVDVSQAPLILTFIIDVTKRKQAEQTLMDALVQEKELGELKTRFVSMASHEFRNPLAVILACVDTMSAYRQKMTDEQIDERLNKVRTQVNHLTAITGDVLQLTRLQTRRVEFNPVALNFDLLCREVLDEFRSRPEIKHQILYSCNDPVQTMQLDTKLMWQIVTNLVSNAIKYSPEADSVTVKLTYAQQSMMLEVSDRGIGIPEADIPRLFDVFHRASNVAQVPGYGLGLVIVKESVELHSGRVAVTSQIGVGTTFTVTIPILSEKENR